ncbi:hypothetical protein Hanom_Chr16g01465991 [Helianthus anomalus]
MSDQGTSDAYYQLPHSTKNEGTSSQPNPGYTADYKDVFVFKAKSEEPFPLKREVGLVEELMKGRK